MATELASVHRLSVDDVLRMVEAGVITADDRVELVDGILLDMEPSGPFHSGVVARLTEHFARAATRAWEVRVQDTLYLADGFLSPDLMIVPRTPTLRDHHHALLVIEVAHTSQRRDDGKVPLYAGARVDEYWQLDLAGEALVVRRGPDGDSYRECARHVAGDVVAALLDAPAVDLAALLRR